MIRAIGIFTLVFLSACASAPGTDSTLDPESGVTIDYTNIPLVMYRDRSGRAAFSRDYVTLAPIKVNRMGQYRYYLWAAIWNTLDQDLSRDQTSGFESLTILADGEPITLGITGWSYSVTGATRPIYSKPVSGAAEAYYEVTADQIRMLAVASSLSLRTSGNNSQNYEPWDSSESARRGFKEFIYAD